MSHVVWYYREEDRHALILAGGQAARSGEKSVRKRPPKRKLPR